MKLLSFSIVLSLLFVHAIGQVPVADSGTFLVHKFAQQIGAETFVAKDSAGLKQYAVSFSYVDRGEPVKLKALIALNKAFLPVSYFIKGGTSRFSQINDSIRISGNKAVVKVDSVTTESPLPVNYFTVAGYSPATTQMLLVRYWKKYNRPAFISLLPQARIQIKMDGEDTLQYNGKPLRLERYVITGLIWGNELLWMNKQGDLICLITNDAEGDKQEMMNAPYESLLPELIQRAAVYGMKLFAKTGKVSVEKHSVVVIKNGTLADVVNGEMLTNTSILIENGIIKKVAKDIRIPAGAKVIDATGKTVLPGLFDMHAHFQQAEWGPAYLAAGVTTVRDCGNEFEYINAVKNAIDNGKGIGPHILKAGIIDGKGPLSLGIVQADNKEEAIAAVDRYKANGYAQIKIYSSAKPAVVKAICDEAHRLGLTVTGHIPEGMNLMQGVDSGMDMVNHLPYVYTILKRNKATRAVDFSDSTSLAVLDFLKTHHVVVDATLGVFELAFRDLGSDINTIEPNFSSLPEPLQVIFKNTGLPTIAYSSYGKPVFGAFKQTFKWLYDAGVPLVAGTDMGFPGSSLHRELEIYVEAGLTPMQSVQLATIAPARLMHIDGQYGSITVNKQADLLITDGNPMEAIRNIRKVSMVLKDGGIYSPTALRQVAGFAQGRKAIRSL